MATGATPAAGKPLTPRALAIWTAVMTVMLAGCLAGLLARVGPVGFTVGFTPLFFLVFGLSWTGRLDRLWPAALATLLVGLWPLYRWLASGDLATAKAFLFLAGFIDAMLLLFMGMEFARRRGWVVTSPARQRVLYVAVLLNFVRSVSGWPTGVWRTGLEVVWWAVLLGCLFLPARRRPPQPNQTVMA